MRRRGEQCERRERDKTCRCVCVCVCRGAMGRRRACVCVWVSHFIPFSLLSSSVQLSSAAATAAAADADADAVTAAYQQQSPVSRSPLSLMYSMKAGGKGRESERKKIYIQTRIFSLSLLHISISIIMGAHTARVYYLRHACE